MSVDQPLFQPLMTFYWFAYFDVFAITKKVIEIKLFISNSLQLPSVPGLFGFFWVFFVYSQIALIHSEENNHTIKFNFELTNVFFMYMSLYKQHLAFNVL